MNQSNLDPNNALDRIAVVTNALNALQSVGIHITEARANNLPLTTYCQLSNDETFSPDQLPGTPNDTEGLNAKAIFECIQLLDRDLSNLNKKLVS